VSPPDAVTVYRGEELSRYGFGHGHPFGTDRQATFWNAVSGRGLDDRLAVARPVLATRAELESFHTAAYVDLVAARSRSGVGFLDSGDTPAFPGVFEAASWVAGSACDALDRLVAGTTRRAFLPIGGLHHARRDRAGGFCVFNDCGIVIELARARHRIRRIAYVDIDAHRDGVLYAFEDDPEVAIADVHEDGRFLYPGTGFAHETGRGNAAGTKLNLPLQPGAGDAEFADAWRLAEAHVEAARPELVILQCGADGLAGDPLAHLSFSPAVHRLAASRLCALADRHCEGRLLAFGGGGYNPAGIADGWSAVVEAMLDG
jgi:acetoin utilization protein AcuC